MSTLKHNSYSSFLDVWHLKLFDNFLKPRTILMNWSKSFLKKVVSIWIIIEIILMNVNIIHFLVISHGLGNISFIYSGLIPEWIKIVFQRNYFKML